MTKYVSRTMDEVWDAYSHFDGDAQEITWFLEELIKKLKDELDYYENLIEDDDD
jgi:hypothetical protein